MPRRPWMAESGAAKQSQKSCILVLCSEQGLKRQMVSCIFIADSACSQLVRGIILARKWKNYTHQSLIRNLRLPFNRCAAFRRLAEYHAAPCTLDERIDWAMNFGGDGYFRIKT